MCMRSYIIKIVKGMRGSFISNDTSPCDLTKPVWASLKELVYYGPGYDSVNIRNDVKAVGCDLKQGVQSAKQELNLAY